MIKAPEAPSIGVVAITATRSQGSVVLIVLCVTIDASSRGVVKAFVVMTLAAAGDDVHPQQRKSGHIVIKGQVARPCLRAVAIIAAGPQLSVVQIALPMAIGTFPGERLLTENSVVARCTGELPVGTLQGKIGFTLVVENTAGPPSRGVAILAFRTEAPIVIILDGVTTRARRFEVLREPSHLAQVAVIAGHLGVLPDEREIGVLVVVETALLPFLGGVTITTSVPHLPPVGVLGGVAILALAESFLVTVPGVTKATIRGEMGPEEREIGLVVIEPGAIPALGLMAIRAVLPQLSVVPIVVAMAVDTQARGLAIRLAADVARGTSHRGVNPLQRKIRHVVIEGLGSEAHDISASAPVLGMADSTVGV